MKTVEFSVACSPYFHDVIVGIVTGVTAGLILAGFFRARDFVIARRERREQIEYFQSLVRNAKTLVCGAAEVDRITGILRDHGKDTPEDHVRLFLFKEFQDDLRSALKERASRLTFDETRELNRALAPEEILKALIPVGVTSIVCSEWLDSFERVSWLGVR